MESISGRKFKTLMESFRAGVAAILEAGDSESGVSGQDVGEKYNIFKGLVQRSMELRKEINSLENIKKLLGEKAVSAAANIKEDFGAKIDKAIKEIDSQNDKVTDKPADETVDDSTKANINSTIDKINEVIVEINKLSDTGSLKNVGGYAKTKEAAPHINASNIQNIDDVKTFGELEKRLTDISLEAENIRSKYNKMREATIGRMKDVMSKKVSASVQIPMKYKKDLDLVIDRLKDIDKYRKNAEALEKKIEIATSDNQDSSGEGIVLDPDDAQLIKDEVDRVECKPGRGRLLYDDFPAAIILFYSIAANRGDFQLKPQTMEELKKSRGDGSPRENIMLALYYTLVKDALSRKKWIIGRTRGVDWQNFETMFKFNLIGTTMQDAGIQDYDPANAPAKLPTHGTFVKAKMPGEGEATANVWPNEMDFDEEKGIGEEALKEKYGGWWTDANGAHYVPRHKKYYDGTGNLVGKINVVETNDREGYITVERKEKFGQGTGVLETCYNISNLIPQGLITATEGKYDNSIALAKLLLGVEDNRAVIEDRGSTALCIFCLNMAKSPDALNIFKSLFYAKAHDKITNLVRELNSQAAGNSAEGSGIINQEFDDMRKSSWNDSKAGGRKGSNSGEQKPERDISDVVTERQERSGGADGNEKAFENPGDDIPVNISKLPQNYMELLDDMYEYCQDHPNDWDPIKAYFKYKTYDEEERKEKIKMYQNILEKGGRPTIMKDDEGNTSYNSRKSDFYSVRSFFDDLRSKGAETEPVDEERIMREIENVAKYDATGILRPLLNKFETVENGVAIPINPPNDFKIGEENKFGKDVIVFGEPNEDVVKDDTIATLAGSFNTRDGGGKVVSNEVAPDWFPAVQNYRNTYDDSMKNVTTYASVVAQICAIVLYPAKHKDLPNKFKNENIIDHISKVVPDSIIEYLTKRMCDTLGDENFGNVSGYLFDDNSGIRRFLDAVIGTDGGPDGMDSIRDAYGKIIDLLKTKNEEMNFKGGGLFKDMYPETGDVQTMSEKAFQVHKDAINSMTIKIQELIDELNESRNPENISYGDMIYLMIYGGLGLTTAEKNTGSGGSYYDAFINKNIKDYEKLKSVSERISIDVCGTPDERIQKMAAAILLLIISTSNDLRVKFYNSFDEYGRTVGKIDEEMDTVKENIENESDPSKKEELKKEYDRLFSLRGAEREKISQKMKNTIIGSAVGVVKNDFNAVVDGIIENVSFDKSNKMNIDTAKDSGELLLSVISGNPENKSSQLKNIISSLEFSKSDRYIASLNKKSEADANFVFSNDIFKKDAEFAQYYKEYELAVERAKDKKQKKPVNAENIIKELKTITTDQMKDALSGNGGLFTSRYDANAGSKTERANAACRAIVIYLIKKVEEKDGAPFVFKDKNKKKFTIGETVNNFALDNAMQDILKDNRKRDKLAEALSSSCGGDGIFSVIAFVNSIKFDSGTIVKYAIRVLKSLVE